MSSGLLLSEVLVAVLVTDGLVLSELSLSALLEEEEKERSLFAFIFFRFPAETGLGGGTSADADGLFSALEGMMGAVTSATAKQTSIRA
jgi:hypothetical protein